MIQEALAPPSRRYLLQLQHQHVSNTRHLTGESEPLICSYDEAGYSQRLRCLIESFLSNLYHLMMLVRYALLPFDSGAYLSVLYLAHCLR